MSCFLFDLSLAKKRQGFKIGGLLKSLVGVPAALTSEKKDLL